MKYEVSRESYRIALRERRAKGLMTHARTASSCPVSEKEEEFPFFWPGRGGEERTEGEPTSIVFIFRASPERGPFRPSSSDACNDSFLSGKGKSINHMGSCA